MASAAISQDHVAIDIRIVDAQTGRIVNATSVEGTPREINGAFAGIFGNTLGGLSGSYKTPIQKAVRTCMIKAVNWIAENSLPPGSIKTQGSTPTPAISHSVAPPAPVAPSPSSDQMVTVTGSRANIRQQPSTQSKVVKIVSQGTVLKKVEEQGDWVSVELSDQTTGWIHKNLVK